MDDHDVTLDHVLFVIGQRLLKHVAELEALLPHLPERACWAFQATQTEDLMVHDATPQEAIAQARAWGQEREYLLLWMFWSAEHVAVHHKEDAPSTS